MAALTQIETLIIGGGPAGLAMAGWLSHLDLPYLLLERQERLAPAWHSHYERLHLHTVKEYSHLPFQPFPDDYPRYVPKALLLRYYEQYAARIGLAARLGVEVAQLARTSEGWEARASDGSRYQAQRVVVATGFNRQPNLPDWPGLASFPGPALHSSAYRSGRAFAGQRVLVVGMGNSGAEIALDLHEQGAEASLSVRGPVNIVLRDVMGRPTQVTAMLLRRLPAWLGDGIGALVSRLTVGDLSKYGIVRPPYAPARQLRERGKTPVIDVGLLPLIRSGKVRVFPAIRQFSGAEAEFADGRRAAFDALVLATGYRSAVEVFLPAIAPLLDPQGHPPFLWHDSLPGAYFLGFDGYSNGVLHSICRDSARIAEHIVSQRTRTPVTASL